MAVDVTAPANYEPCGMTMATAEDTNAGILGVGAMYLKFKFRPHQIPS